MEAGADSVYFGLSHFTARAKTGFTLAELPEVMRTLHRRGVKGFVTFNTLVFDSELNLAAETLAAIARAGADAVIVQDLGICEVARTVAPGLEIHASTQMSITNAGGAQLAARLGATRVNLARELSLEEIRQIRAAVDVELEVFVHGALCVAYSGQCFSSEAWGGRSANRGQCAQACRLPYELQVDGAKHPTGDARYLLSPGDLYTLEYLPQLVAAGVSALKIEGRYKNAEYVALTTAAYRRALDGLSAVDPMERLRLEQVYSRGMGPYFLSGADHPAVVRGRAPRHRGVLMGQVERVGPDRVWVRAGENHRLAPLKPGDGLVFDAADWRSPQEREEGGRVYSVQPTAPGVLELTFQNNALDFSRIRKGDWVWRSADPDVDKAAAALPSYARPVAVEVEARLGAPLILRWRLGKACVEVCSEAPLALASRQKLTVETLREQLGRLGGTGFALGSLAVNIEGDVFAPVSLLNRLRRKAVQQLTAALEQVKPAEIHPWQDPAPLQPATPAAAAQLHLLVRNRAQLDAALRLPVASITLDFLDLYGLWPALEAARASGIPIRVATPRVIKPGEEKMADFLARLGFPLLVRSAGLLELFREWGIPHLTGDFSLNAANHLTAKLLLQMGLERLTPTHDLNARQICGLARRGPAAQLEVVAYQHLPVFHTEHCVFCRFLSTGASYLNCGRPCEKHEVALVDEAGRPHPVLADVGCRNTVFGAEAQHGAAYLQDWLAAGISHFRLEFVHESPEELTGVTRAFADYLAGHLREAELECQLRRLAPAGVTPGSLLAPQAEPLFRIL
jgi:putative protease